MAWRGMTLRVCEGSAQLIRQPGSALGLVHCCILCGAGMQDTLHFYCCREELTISAAAT